MSLEHAPEHQDGAGTVPGRLLDEYTTRQELAKELGIGVRTLARIDAMRKGPPRLMLGGRIFYHREQARAWLKSRLSEQAAV